MKVLFAAGEVWPFVKTGGLGDVAYSLPKAPVWAVGSGPPGPFFHCIPPSGPALLSAPWRQGGCPPAPYRLQ